MGIPTTRATRAIALLLFHNYNYNNSASVFEHIKCTALSSLHFSLPPVVHAQGGLRGHLLATLEERHLRFHDQSSIMKLCKPHRSLHCQWDTINFVQHHINGNPSSVPTVLCTYALLRLPWCKGVKCFQHPSCTRI